MINKTLLLKKINFRFILLTVLALPLTGINGFDFLGELKADASSHIVILGLFFYFFFLLKKRKIIIPLNLSYSLLILFLGWALLCSLISFPNYTYVFKERSGYNKFLLQFSLLIFYAIPITIYFYHIFRTYSQNYIFRNVRRTVLLSFWAVSIYAFLEILHLYGFTFMEPFLTLVDKVIRDEQEFKFIGLGRVRSLSAEPPFLAMYLAFATPWLLSYFLTQDRKYSKFLILLLIIIITYFSGSRSGLILILAEFIIFISLVTKIRIRKQAIKKALLLAPILFIALLFYGPSVGTKLSEKFKSLFINSDSDLQISSISRWGTQIAALKIASENPILGVGIGQQGFYFPEFYPKWAVSGSYEIRNWKSDDPEEPWPPGFSLYTRLAAETGFIGVLIFLLFNGTILLKLLIIRYKRNNRDPLLIVGITCFVGLLINYLQFDSFRLNSYWLIVSLCLVLIKNSTKTVKNNNI